MWSNYSNRTDSVSARTSGNYLLIVITSINVIVSLICLLYITLRLTLNKFIKAILCILAIQNIMSHTVITIANAVIILTERKSFITCNFLTQTLIVVNRANVIMPPLISILRYTMAWKASFAKFLKEKYIYYAIISSAIFPYFNLLINIYLNNGCGRLTSMCLDLEMIGYTNSILQLLFNIPIHIIFSCCGIFFDLKMLAFVKRQNKIQPIAMIPWKTSDPNDEEKDIDVPMKATIISTSSLLSSYAIYYLFKISEDFWTILCLVSTYYILPLPILLIFTIKQKSNKKVTVKPPQTLQFHDENLDDSNEQDKESSKNNRRNHSDSREN